jgi:hypothetical protein
MINGPDPTLGKINGQRPRCPEYINVWRCGLGYLIDLFSHQGILVRDNSTSNTIYELTVVCCFRSYLRAFFRLLFPPFHRASCLAAQRPRNEYVSVSGCCVMLVYEC